MADFPVKWFSSDMGGSPNGSDEPGELIELLKACLMTGFNVTPVNALTYDSGANEARAELGAGHGFLKHQVISISGADQAGFNGEFRITDVGTTWVAFSPDSNPGSESASGDLIEIKAAPIGGWEVVAEDADRNRIVLASTNERSNGLCLHVQNDNWNESVHDNARYYYRTSNPQPGARVKIVSNVVSVDDYELSETARWPIGWSNSSEGREWSLIGDDRLFYLTTRHAWGNGRSTMCYGEFDSNIAGDAFGTVIVGTNYSSSISWNRGDYSNHIEFASYGITSQHYIARPYHQMPSDEKAMWKKMGIGFASGIMFDYPNPADYGLYVHNGPTLVMEISDDKSILRGVLPGLIQPLQTPLAYHKSVLDDLPGLEGVPVIMWLSQYEGNTSSATHADVNNAGMLGWRLDKWRDYQ
ncbi:hypothetical protein [Cobetia amphilecti]|uniref:hypothetical protein n=1 Tax=Cobetia amphilecti TaxID=1055104 RepID=UPI0012EC0947|nr:hypothetical protein [Cobetia amphilecti]